jgi:hypothetical protein
VVCHCGFRLEEPGRFLFNEVAKSPAAVQCTSYLQSPHSHSSRSRSPRSTSLPIKPWRMPPLAAPPKHGFSVETTKNSHVIPSTNCFILVENQTSNLDGKSRKGRNAAW